MPKLRTLSGDDLLRIFKTAGFVPFTQRGSHIKLRRTLPNGVRQTLTVVNHSEIAIVLANLLSVGGKGVR